MFIMLRKGLPLLVTVLATLVFAGPRLVAAAGAHDPTLLAEGERRQVIEFNPNAALQRRIFADGFVPNSSEFRVQFNGISYAAQRAEHLRFGTVRVYYVAVGDWADMRYAQRGGAGGSLAATMLAEGERRQVIQFNPSAALQQRIFADGFVPNSPEFRTQAGGVNYAGQRAEHLGTGRVRVYYVVVGAWRQVTFAERGAVVYQPRVSLSPTNGPAGTYVQIDARDFPANMAVKVYYQQEGRDRTLIAEGRTDSNGRFTAEQRILGLKGTRWMVTVVANNGAQAQSPWFNVTN